MDTRQQRVVIPKRQEANTLGSITALVYRLERVLRLWVQVGNTQENPWPH